VQRLGRREGWGMAFNSAAAYTLGRAGAAT
jgi:hypothetical protein